MASHIHVTLTHHANESTGLISFCHGREGLQKHLRESTGVGSKNADYQGQGYLSPLYSGLLLAQVRTELKLGTRGPGRTVHFGSCLLPVMGLEDKALILQASSFV